MIRLQGAIAALLLVLPFARAVQGADTEIQSAKLNFTPYSSSYLPFETGYLTRKGVWKELDDYWLVDPKVSDQLKESVSTAEKLDEIRRRVLEKRNPLAPALEKSYFNPAMPAWAGLCHQWSAASIEPEISGFIEKTSGLICDGILLSRGELKELFTAFYELPPAIQYGERTYRRLKDHQADIRTELGVDDFPAHVFHREVFENLGKNQGVILDLDPGPDVWNHPVFKADSTIEKLGLDDILKLKHVPLYLFESADPEVRKLLAKLKALDLILMKAANETTPVINGEARQLLESLLSEGADVEPGTDFVSDLGAVLAVRLTMIKTNLGAAFAQGKLQLSPGFVAKKVITEVEYGREVSFADNLINVSSSRSFEYLLIEKDGKVVDSVWRTENYMRPDFLWIPSRLDLKALPSEKGNQYREALKELRELSERCVDVRRAAEFRDALTDAVSDNVVTKAEKGALLKRYSEIKKWVNPDLIKNALLSGGTVSGLSEADFN